MLPHLILMTALNNDFCYCPHFKDEETESQVD